MRFLFGYYLFSFVWLIACQKSNTTPLKEAMVSVTSTDHKPIQDSLSYLEKLLDSAAFLENKGLFHSGIAMFDDALLWKQLEKERFAFQFAEIHKRLADLEDKRVNADGLFYHTKKFRYYYTLHNPGNKAYEALYYAYLSRYYNLQILPEKAYSLSEKAVQLFKQTEKLPPLYPAYKIYSCHLFSIRNSDHSFESKAAYKDTLLQLLESSLFNHQTEVPLQRVSAHMFLMDSAVSAIKQYCIHPFNRCDLSPVADRFITTLRHENKRLSSTIGEKNPFIARNLQLIGLLHYFANQLSEASTLFDTAISMYLLADSVTSAMFTPYSAQLASALLWKSWCLEKEYYKQSSVDILLEREQILNKLAKVWHFYMTEIVVTQATFNRNKYTQNPYADLQETYVELYKHTKKEHYKSKIYQCGELSGQYSLFFALSQKNKPKNLKQYKQAFLDFEKLYSGNKTDRNPDFPSIETPFDFYLQSDLNFVKNRLQANEALILYNKVNQNNNHGLIVQVIEREKDTIFELQVKNLQEIEWKTRWLPEHRSLIEIPSHLYQQEAYTYYKQLFQPIHAYLSKEINALKIIRNPFLENLFLPFELLTTKTLERPNYKQLPYFISHYAINYPLSYQLQIPPPNPGRKKLIVFIAQNNKLEGFHYAEKFVRNLQSKYVVEIVKGKEATKTKAKELLKEDAVFILIGHGQGNVEESEQGIYLSDGFLGISEIHSISCQSPLLILAGCSTGVGFRSQEGNINLARAFTLSGATSVMITDWDVDEKPTLLLVETFIEKLKEGEGSAHALQKAKLAFLKKCTTPLANPYYWAGFILIGPNQSIEIQSKNNFDLLQFAYIVLAGIAILLFIRNNHIKRKKANRD